MGSKTLKATLREQIEADTGKPVGDALRDLAFSGLTVPEVAERYGVSKYAIRSLKSRLGVDWRWPEGRSTIHHRRENPTRMVVVEYQGERITLAEVARLSGVRYSTVHMRYQRGVRGDALGAPATGNGPPPSQYELGLSVRDWNIVAAFARENGVKRAAEKFGVPKGAVSAVLRGEWEKLD